ncbi:hypothetical protein CRUP_022734 [Coryphaenoides rupestris]|nr:hypothetical protein CRUP_022734 [Coryphaenoides rupestris]
MSTPLEEEEEEEEEEVEEVEEVVEEEEDNPGVVVLSPLRVAMTGAVEVESIVIMEMVVQPTGAEEEEVEVENRFSALNTQQTFDKREGGEGAEGRTGGNEQEKLLEVVKNDMEAKAVDQLFNRWRTRVQELRLMTRTTGVAVLAELNNPTPQASSAGFGAAPSGFGAASSGFGAAPSGFGAALSGFGAAPSGFGSSTSGFETGFGSAAAPQASTFSFAAPAATTTTGGFGGPSALAGFAVASATPAPPPATGFGASQPSTASSFSFAVPPDPNKATTAAGFGSTSASTFNFSSSTAGSGFGVAATAASGSVFGQKGGGFGSSAAAAAGAGAAGGTRVSAAGPGDSLFTPQSELTPEEVGQFRAKRFTLGQIPLKPPPADMLAGF